MQERAHELLRLAAERPDVVFGEAAPVEGDGKDWAAQELAFGGAAEIGEKGFGDYLAGSLSKEKIGNLRSSFARIVDGFF